MCKPLLEVLWKNFMLSNIFICIYGRLCLNGSEDNFEQI